MLVGAGAAEGAVDAANILKPSLARGELQCIGATTLDEYRKHIETRRRPRAALPADPGRGAVASRRRSRSSRASRSATKSTTSSRSRDEALKAAAELAARYVPDRFLPDKAIDLVDEAASPRAHPQRSTTPPSLQGSDARASRASARRRTQAIAAAAVRVRRRAARPRAEAAGEDRRAWRRAGRRARERQARRHRGGHRRSRRDVDRHPGRRASPAKSRSACCRWRTRCTSKVIGQDEAITAIAKAVRRARAGLKDPKRPIGVFIFLGPTGVGKTVPAAGAGRVHVRQRRRHDQARHVASSWRSTTSRGWSARLPATSATTTAASSPTPCAASRTA